MRNYLNITLSYGITNALNEMCKNSVRLGLSVCVMCTNVRHALSVACTKQRRLSISNFVTNTTDPDTETKTHSLLM